MPVPRIHQIARGKRRVIPKTAWRQFQALGTTPESWIHLQTAHELAAAYTWTGRVARGWRRRAAEVCWDGWP